MAIEAAQKAKELVAQMTLEEKASLCSGKNFWETKAVERLGVAAFMVTDYLRICLSGQRFGKPLIG